MINVLYGGVQVTYLGEDVVFGSVDGTTKWSRGDFIPKFGLEDWFAGDAAILGGLVPDISGNVRDFSQDTTPPELQTNIINGYPAIYWAGTKNPLVSSGGDVPVQHVFIVGSFGNASFAGSEGLLSDSATAYLYGDGAASTKFHDTGEVAVYKKNGVSFAAGNMQAPVNSVISILEVQFSDLQTFVDGITIGKNPSSATKWKGHIAEMLVYSRKLTEPEQYMVYEYLAMKYWLWQKSAVGLDIFPFASNRSRSMQRDRETFLSEPYTGDPKALVRGDFLRSYGLSFSLRKPEEFDAAEAFHAQHHPIMHFMYRDFRFYPARDREVRFASQFREQGSEVTYRFNYGFDLIETA